MAFVDPANLSIEVTDTHHMRGSMSFRVAGATTAAAIETVATALEAVSNGKVCSYRLSRSGVFAGKAVAENLAYFDRHETANLKFTNVANCKDSVRISFPAPKQGIFVGAGNNVLDIANAGIITLAAAITAILVDDPGEVFGLDSGYRKSIDSGVPTLG